MSSNYKIIKSGRSLDLAYQLGAMTRRDCHVASLLTMTMIGLFSFNAYAECTPTPDCVSIGYTETSCEGDSLKCPFDISKLYCIPCDSSYKYACDGTNEEGVGEACGGKYVACTTACGEEYQYTCDDYNEIGGIGESCNGLYKECACFGGPCVGGGPEE